MRLELPYPPSANDYWRIAKSRIFVTARAKAYKNAVRWRALQLVTVPFDGPVTVNVTVYRPRQIGDLDNCLKILLDALRGVAFEDDKQVVELHALRLDDKANPRAVVTIEPSDPNLNTMFKPLSSDPTPFDSADWKGTP